MCIIGERWEMSCLSWPDMEPHDWHLCAPPVSISPVRSDDRRRYVPHGGSAKGKVNHLQGKAAGRGKKASGCKQPWPTIGKDQLASTPGRR
jgi:hypothetical protein